MEVRLAGKNLWQKVILLLLVSGLIFAALYKWSTVVRVVLQLGLLIYVIRQKRSELFKSLIRMPLLPMTVYMLFVGLTVPFSVDRLESIQSWMRLFEMYVIAVSVYHLLENAGRVRAALFYIIVAFGFACIVDIQWYLRYLGEKWVWGAIWDAPVNFNHHNTYSAICVALIPVAVTFVIAGKQFWMRFVAAVFLIMDLFLFYVLQSRTAQISLAFVLIITGFFLSTVKRKIVYTAVVVILFVAAVINIRHINPRWLDESVGTAFGRTENWGNALSLIKERPVLGYGYGRKIYGHVYTERFGELRFKGHRLKIPHAHSGYLDRLFANGIIGLLLFLWIPVTVFAGLIRQVIRQREDWIVARAILLSLAGTFFYLFADIHDGVQWGLMWVFMALALRLSQKPVKGASPLSEG